MQKKVLDVVGAAIYDEGSERYLVTMRDREKHRGGLWEFPGGKIEKGESPEEALIREIDEELGCSIEVLKFLEDYTQEYEEFIVRLRTYQCRISAGSPSLKEHEDMRWVTKDEMSALSFPEADIPTVRKLIGGSIIGYER
ncbi:MAG: (deoxy)nucleoside triphosphate pyrophosphohydrolase [Bacillota bacterium]|nr:(deoxy)nucleoside triphosphate pyrophosphohydrolase [Bacillota bacterium]